MAQPDRRLVPIVSLDVVGYSRLAEINERQTLRLVQRVYDRLVARTIGRYGGKVALSGFPVRRAAVGVRAEQLLG